jgi:hypothetical protein
MSTFAEVISAVVGAASDNADLRLSLARLYEYGFASGPQRFWRGQGRLFTSDGRTWLGTVDGAGRDHHSVPSFADGRDGAEEDLEFGFPFLDKATFDAIKGEREEAARRTITCYLAVVLAGEGLRPTTPVSFFGEYVIQSATFSDLLTRSDDGTIVRAYGVKALAKGGSVGGSRAPRGTYTDTCQQQRAALLGVDPDYGCGFVASIANETLTFP